jgi:hypothetical protein
MARHLFLDNRYIASLEGPAVRAHEGVKHPDNPLLEREYPWEASRLQIGGQSVIYDPARKMFRMYYMGSAGPRWPWIKLNGRDMPGHSTIHSYAESDDGVHWHRPMISQRSFNDIAETNIFDIFRGQSGERCGVLYDAHEPDPNRRYKMLAWDQKAQPLPDGEMLNMDGKVIVKDKDGRIIAEDTYNTLDNHWGVEYAYSADGTHWTRYADGPVITCYNDTGTSLIYDEHLRRYVAFGRFNGGDTFTATDVTFANRTGTAFNIGRNVARVESDDCIHWSEPELVIPADRDDPQSLQIDAMVTAMYEGMYVGIMECDRRPYPDSHLPIQIAASHDGRQWTRVADRFAFIRIGEDDAWDCRAVRPGGGPICFGDKVMAYYSGCGHEGGVRGVGLVTWRRDGFVSIYADAEGGELLTRPFIPAGPEIHLNIDASDGEAIVRVCDSQGEPYEGWSKRYAGLADNTINPQTNVNDRPDDGWNVSRPSQPIRGDHLDTVVQWPDSDMIHRVGKPISLRVQMRNADLYSFWTE